MPILPMVSYSCWGKRTILNREPFAHGFFVYFLIEDKGDNKDEK